MMRLRSSFVPALLAVAVFGCGGKTNNGNTNTQSPDCVGLHPGEFCGQGSSFPIGAIEGRVTSLTDGSPLKGVSVSVAAQPAVTTDDNGYYEIKGLPAGATYRVHFSLSSYVSAFAEGTLPDAAGNYPQGNAIAEVNKALSPATAGITGKVYVSGGTPAAGAVVGVDMRGQGYEVATQVTAGADGTFTVSGLPGSPTGVPVTVVVQPYDADRDGRADYDVVEVTGSLFQNVTTRVDVDLSTAAQALRLLSSNVDEGTHNSGDPLVLIFNRALIASSLEVTLTDTDLSRQIANTFALDSTGTQLTITPSGGKLTVGDHYRLSVFAIAQNTASGTFSRGFDEITTTSPTSQVTGLVVKPNQVDWRTTTFTLTWNPLTGAAAYRVYAKDNQSNTAYQLLATTGNTPTPSATVSLPSSFDWFTGDGFQSPFANGTEVDFVVVPEDVLGNAADPGTATPVKLTDNTAPRILSAIQDVNADNTNGSAPVTLKLSVQYSEYMKATPAPTIQLPTGLTASYEADPNMLTGTFTIIIPAGVNGTGSFLIAGAQDSSGNALASFDGTLRTQVQLVADPSFESGTLASWTPTNTSTANAPAIVSTPVYSGAYAVRLGNSTSSTEGGYSQIVQIMNVPNGSTQVVVTVHYQTYTSYQASGHDYVECDLYTGGGTYIGQVFKDYLNLTSYQTATQTFTVSGGTQIKLQCFSYQDGFHDSGGYLDDISVLSN